jgi:hypothetical protein
VSDTTRTRTQVRDDHEAMIAENAAKAFAEHAVTVEREDGLYRHYRCARPGTGNYAFHVVTFPGRLIVCGDIGDMAWERCPDMIEWAADAVESIGYFAEKVWRSIEVREWCEAVARAVVEEEHADRVRDLDEGESEAREKLDEVRDELLAAIDSGEHAFVDAYYQSDWYDGDFPNLRGFTSEFLWCREAVRWFLKWHKARQRPGAKETHPC